MALVHFPARCAVALKRVQPVDTRAAILTRIPRALVDVRAVVPEPTAFVADMTGALDLIVAEMLTPRILGALVFTSCAWVNGLRACLTCETVTAVALKGVDTVIADGEVVLGLTRVAVVVQDAVVVVQFASRPNEALNARA